MRDSELIEICEKIQKDVGVRFVMFLTENEYKKDEVEIIFSKIWEKDTNLLKAGLIKSLREIESNTDVKFKIEPDRDGCLEPDELLVHASNVWEG